MQVHWKNKIDYASDIYLQSHGKLIVRAAHLTIEQVHLEFSGSYDRCDLLVFTCLFTCTATDRGPHKLRCRAGVISWHLASFMFIEWSKHHIYWHVSGHSLPDTLPSSHWHTFIFWGSSIFWPPLMDVADHVNSGLIMCWAGIFYQVTKKTQFF